MKRSLSYRLDTEPEIRELYDFACRGADSIFLMWTDMKKALETPEGRGSFFRAAHRGFSRAQERILDKMTDGATPPGNILLYRKVMDAIAWQMLHTQLYLARRLYRDQEPPNLLHSNLMSVRRVGAQLTSSDFFKFALVSDATSFVQLGDLLVADPAEALTLVEVKEGATNMRIMEFIHRFTPDPCERAVYHFREQEGPKVFEQLGRVLRQGGRMEHVVELMRSGRSTDPDTDQTVLVPDDPIEVESYDSRLAALLEQAKVGGWAIEVVDECLFIGAYRHEPQRRGAGLFRAWFEHCSGNSAFPMCDLLQCMAMPLALPLFSRDIPREQKFDLLYGRASVFLGLDVDAFIELSRARDLPVRWSTKKEAARINHGVARAHRAWTCDGRALVLEGESGLASIHDGLFLRIFFHGASPRTATEVVYRMFQQQRDHAAAGSAPE